MHYITFQKQWLHFFLKNTTSRVIRAVVLVLGLRDNSSDGRPKAKGLVIEEEPVSVKGASNEEPASGKSSVEEA